MPASPDDRQNPRRIAFRGTLGWAWTILGPFIGLLLITALFAILTRQSGMFLTVYNWRTIAVQTVIVGAAAVGMTIIMVAGGIDLSVGSAVALITVCIAMFVKQVDPLLPDSLREWKLVVPAALVLGVLVGGLCGAINGALIAGLRVVPFIISLGTLTIYRGMAKWLASSTSVTIPGQAKPWWFGRILAPEPEPSWLLLCPASGPWLS